MESVGFKEWALVCEALGRGEQSILLRKGGIAEGREGFQFGHTDFFLFPTFFHEQLGKTRAAAEKMPEQRDGEIAIQYLARLDFAALVTQWETARALEPFHILKREVVRERFDSFDAPGIHVAFVRVLRLEPAWIFPAAARYGGCRSWVKLPVLPAATQLHPVATEREHAGRLAAFREIVARGS